MGDNGHMDDVEHIPNVRVPRQFEAFYRQEYAVVLALTYVLSGSRPAASRRSPFWNPALRSHLSCLTPIATGSATYSIRPCGIHPAVIASRRAAPPSHSFPANPSPPSLSADSYSKGTRASNSTSRLVMPTLSQPRFRCPTSLAPRSSPHRKRIHATPHPPIGATL